MDSQVVISLKTILFTFLMVLAGYVVYRLGPIIGMVVVALLIVISVEPVIKKIMRTTFLNKPIPRGLAVLLTYFLLIVVFLGVLTTGIQPVLDQIGKLFTVVTDLINDYKFLESLESLNISLESFIPEIPSSSTGVLKVLGTIYSNFVAIVSVLVISLYTSLDWNNLKQRFFSLFSGRLKSEIEDTVFEVEEKLGHWVKGQLILMFAVGLLSFSGLVILRIPYPLALGIISGTLEFIPMFGPFISGVLAAIVGFSSSFAQGISAVVWFILVQEIENNLLVPRVMHKASGFSPLFVLLAILVGGEFFGFLGIVLAVPLSMVLGIILKKLLSNME